MITYISIIALTSGISAATIDETEIQNIQNESFLTHIAQADTTTATDDDSETDDYIEWTFL